MLLDYLIVAVIMVVIMVIPVKVFIRCAVRRSCLYGSCGCMVTSILILGHDYESITISWCSFSCAPGGRRFSFSVSCIRSIQLRASWYLSKKGADGWEEEGSGDILSNRVLEFLSNTRAQLTNCNISVFDISEMSERDKKVVEQIGKIVEDIDRPMKRLN